jgi:hypothetical protein
MRHLRNLAAGFVILVLLLPAQAQEAAERPTSWLLVIQGEVTAIGDGTMSLAAEPKIVAFTDRPERRTALLDLAKEVASLWGEGGAFAAVPPNASVVNETEGVIGIVELASAVIEGGLLRLDFVSLEGALPTVGDVIALTVDMERDDIIEY